MSLSPWVLFFSLVGIQATAWFLRFVLFERHVHGACVSSSAGSGVQMPEQTGDDAGPQVTSIRPGQHPAPAGGGRGPSLRATCE